MSKKLFAVIICAFFFSLLAFAHAEEEEEKKDLIVTVENEEKADEFLEECENIVDDYDIIVNNDEEVVMSIGVKEEVPEENAMAVMENSQAVQEIQKNHVYKISNFGYTDKITKDKYARNLTTKRSFKQIFEDYAYSAGFVSDKLDDEFYKKIRNTQYYLFETGIHDVWREFKKKQDVTVAVFDTGVMSNHKDLEGRISRYSYDAIKGETVQKAKDAEGHGTSVAGIISAKKNNDIGIAGISDADILSIRVGDKNGYIDTESFIKGCDYLISLIEQGKAKNVRVANMSWGGYYDTEEEWLESKEREAIKKLKEYGILCLASAGNGGYEGMEITAGGYPLMYPSDDEDVISVTGCDYWGYHDYWTDWNKDKDIAAPSLDIRTLNNKNNKSTIVLDGTSFAAPIVSGIAALLFEANPSLSVEEMAGIIKNSAGKLGVYNIEKSDSPKAKKCISGIGIVDAAAAYGKAVNKKIKKDISYCSVSGDDFVYSNRFPKGKYEIQGYGLAFHDKNIQSKYEGAKDIGAGTITVKGKNIYTGKVTGILEIVPKPAKIKSALVNFQDNRLKLEWKKLSGKADGCEIEYASDKKFLLNPKKINVKNGKATKKTIKSKKNKLYVRIRAYSTVNGRKYYSAWSKTKMFKQA